MCDNDRENPDVLLKFSTDKALRACVEHLKSP